MGRFLRISMLCLVLVHMMPASGYPQEKQVDIDLLKKQAPKVFLDCDSCDLDFIRTEITFVNYVRDRTEAQIHILVTTMPTASGGTEYTMTFSGQGEFAGKSDTYKYVSGNTDTSDEVRKGMTGMLKIGLIAYVGKTPIASRLSISLMDKIKPTSVEDKWNSWVFSFSFGGSFSGEVSQRYSSVRGSFSANRVTPAWKFRSSISANKYTDTFEFEDEKIVSTSKSQNLNLLLVKSLNNHWSAGSFLTASSSTYSNIKTSVNPAPAVEYDLFPYSESTRHQFRILYKPGFRHFRYREETIYDKTAEGLWGQALSATFELHEKWGFVSNTFEVSHYFSDIRKNHIENYADVSLRIFKGLSLTLYGGYSRIHDQLSLPKGNATLEEVLLRRRQLATSYSYYGSIGFSYTFGSIFSNVVNPRFGGY